MIVLHAHFFRRAASLLTVWGALFVLPAAHAQDLPAGSAESPTERSAKSFTEGLSENLSLRGHAGFEFVRYPQFLGEGGVRNPVQARSNVAARAQIDASYSAHPAVSLALRGFVRQDRNNHERDAARWDEAWVQYAAPQWDVRVGNQLVTWGSVESVSPLDIVNPRDYEEDVVDPRKIGTLAGRFRWRFSSSDLSLYWLPRYEPTRLAGARSYYGFSGGLAQIQPEARYDGSQWAARYFHSFDSLDVGISHFSGLERNPAFQFDFSRAAFVGSTYPVKRWGLDVARSMGDAVFKGEFVYRTSDQDGNRHALLYVLGAEYNLASVWRHSDLTLFAEYLASSHNVENIELMQNDVFVAARWTLNDHYRQRVQLGTIRDLDQSGAHVYRVEYLVSPLENIEMMFRYTDSRDYYPGPRHVERDDGVFHFLVKYNF